MMSDTPAILGGIPAFPELMRFVRPWVPTERDVGELLGQIRSSRWLTNQGPQASAFEREISRFLGVDGCVVVCNGTLGLMLTLKALGIGGKVLVPAFTFAATAHAVRWSGCEPVFVDVEPRYWTIDPEAVRQGLSAVPHVQALIGVHLFGNPCDTETLESLAAEHGVPVVYDAAHVFGTTVQGRTIAADGHACVFSFHATKPFHTGEGGAVMSPHRELLKRVAELRNFGFVRGADCDSVGLNAKMPEMAAGFGRLLLGVFPEHMRRRNEVIDLYRERLRDTPGIELAPVRVGVQHNGSYCPVTVNRSGAGLTRDDLFWALMAENIETRPYFNPPLHRMAVYAATNPARLPVSERLSREVLCLPVYSDMVVEEAARIVEAIVRVIRAAGAVRDALATKQRPAHGR